MSDDLTVLGPDGIRRSYDEHYDTMMDVEQDPTGAWQAIQTQHYRIAKLEAELYAMTEDRNIVLETSQQQFIRIEELEALVDQKSNGETE